MSRTRIPSWSFPFAGPPLSRRRFLTTAAGAVGALSAAFLLPRPVWAGGGDVVLPNPIPGGLTGADFGFPDIDELFHILLPDLGDEPSLITDFNGFIGSS